MSFNIIFITFREIPIRGERKLLALQNDTYTSDAEQYSSYAEEEETEPEQSATCLSRFDTTVGIILFTSGVLYCFVGLAIICEGEFKDSVVELANFLKLPPDVAGLFLFVVFLIFSCFLTFLTGATLMAAGTSSPELFTSLVALAGPVADIGTGTVVGSGND